MQHHHFEELNSTQIYLKDQIDSLWKIDKNILISCENQRKGEGRRGRTWVFYPGSLAFSFTLQPANPLTLTSLEVALLIRRFFFKKHDVALLLKWPNDLMRQDHKKCGGILCSYVSSQKIIIVGVGINVVGEDQILDSRFLTPAGLIFQNGYSLDKEKLSSEIYNFILQNRLQSKEILEGWLECSAHLGKDVEIMEQNEKIKGKFLSLSPDGAAIVETLNGQKRILSGDMHY